MMYSLYIIHNTWFLKKQLLQPTNLQATPFLSAKVSSSDLDSNASKDSKSCRTRPSRHQRGGGTRSSAGNGTGSRRQGHGTRHAVASSEARHREEVGIWSQRDDRSSVAGGFYPTPTWKNMGYIVKNTGSTSHKIVKFSTSWWFFSNPPEKICHIVKLDHATPRIVGVNIKKLFELPPPSYILEERFWKMERLTKLWINVVYSCIYRSICLDIFCPIGDMICLLPCNF